MKHLVKIPFSGFYESSHSYLVDDVIERFWPYSEETGEAVYPEGFWETFSYPENWSTEYAKLYAYEYMENLSDETGLKIGYEFDELSSPKEYNFSTDRVFITISKASARKLFNIVDKDKLTKLSRDSFTSYSGFFSLYDPNWRTWGAVEKWDHNQTGVLFEALFDPDSWKQHEWMHELECNGVISSLFDAAYTKWEAQHTQLNAA